MRKPANRPTRLTLASAGQACAVKAVLAELPVFGIEYVKYHNFSRQVFKAQERYMGGYALEAEVQLLVEKRVARKCDRHALDQIRSEVFSIKAPAS